MKRVADRFESGRAGSTGWLYVCDNCLVTNPARSGPHNLPIRPYHWFVFIVGPDSSVPRNIHACSRECIKGLSKSFDIEERRWSRLNEPI